MTHHLRTMCFFYLACFIVAYGYWLSSVALFILCPFYLSGIALLSSNVAGRVRRPEYIHYRFLRHSVDILHFFSMLKTMRLHILLSQFAAYVHALAMAELMVRKTCDALPLYRDALVTENNNMVDHFTEVRCQYLGIKRFVPDVLNMSDLDTEMDLFDDEI